VGVTNGLWGISPDSALSIAVSYDVLRNCDHF